MITERDGLAACHTVTIGGTGGSLEGITEEVLASSRSLLEASRGGGPKGLQQYFTPPKAALFVQAVVNPAGRLRAFDPTAGDGSLLWPHARRYGVEIHEPNVRNSKKVRIGPSDPRQDIGADDPIPGDLGSKPLGCHSEESYAEQSYCAVRGDFQHVYPLLRLSGQRFSAVVANPPFGLSWQIRSLNGGEPGSSTLIAWLACQRLVMRGGQGAFVCGSGRLEREILGLPDAGQAIYCAVEIERLFDGVDLKCAIAFWADPELRRNDETFRRLRASTAEDLDGLVGTVTDERERRFRGLIERDYSEENAATTGADVFRLIQDAYARRTAERLGRCEYDVSLAGDRVQVRLSPLAVSVMETRRELATSRPFLTALHGQRSSYFALNTRDWRKLREAVESDLITLDPKAILRIEQVVDQAAGAACPLYRIEPQQRLAYVQDLERLECVMGDPDRGYLAGRDYAVDVSTQIVSRERTETRNNAGEVKTYTFRADCKALRVTVTSDTARHYSETKEDIQYLLEHFDIPDPGDVSTRNPEQVEAWRNVIRRVQATRLMPGIAPRDFQVEDVARLLLKGSGVLSWEQGGGKTFGSMLAAAAFEEAKESDGNALFVVPQDLIPQWQAECRRFFGRDLVHIRTRGHARDVKRGIRDGSLTAGWYVTHYEALGINGLSADGVQVLDRIRDGQFTCKRVPAKLVRGRSAMAEVALTRYSAASNGGDAGSKAALLTTADACPRCTQTEASGEWNGYRCRRCGEVWARLVLRPMAHELSTAFRRGCVVVDEGTKIKADYSLTSLAVRGMRARHRLLLTGTPQKNYVHDLFHLLSWALGPASARFPFAWGREGKAKFESDFCVVERLVGGSRRKVLPEVTNLSVLWRLLSGAIVRRRKENMGEPIVERTFVPVTVPFGTAQREQYVKWLNGFSAWYAASHGGISVRQIDSQSAVLGQLVKLEYATTLPQADPDAHCWGVPVSNWTPKMLKVLEIAASHASAGEQVLVGSDLMQTGRFLAGSLSANGICASDILGQSGQTLSPGERAERIREFVGGAIRVLCATVQSIALGHNLDCASVVILAGLPWDFATLDQFLARVHRLTSKDPVTVYVVLTEGSLDERKWKLLQDKTASAELVVDGQMVEKKQKPISQQQILNELKRKGLPVADTVPESEIGVAWQRLSLQSKPATTQLVASSVLRMMPLYDPAVAPDRRVAQLSLF